MINILLFASLRESIGATSMRLSIKLPCSVAQLKQQAGAENSVLAKAQLNQALLVAVNQVIADDEVMINTGDEVAFFPPVTGG